MPVRTWPLGGLASVAGGEVGDEAVVVAKPLTFMNRSGRAAAALCGHFDLAPDRLAVVVDDADLELGRIRVRPGGGTGGHNGIESLIDELATDRFPRIRLGVRGEGREDAELADYVLSPFEPDERPTIDALVDLGADAVESIVRHGLEFAMNTFNGKAAVPPER